MLGGVQRDGGLVPGEAQDGESNKTKTSYISVSAMANKQWQALCKAVNHPEWLEDERFATPALRDQHANERLQLTQEALLNKSAEQWLEILEQAGVPCAPVLNRAEMIEHPVIKASKLIIETQHPVAGAIRQTRPAARFSKTEPEIRRGAPLLGEHNAEILGSLGYDEQALKTLREEGVIT